MNPLFSVGEVVILKSVSRPDLNGDTSVLHVLQDGDCCVCRLTGKRLKNNTSGLAYVLDIDLIEIDGVCTFWDQSALRKKHQPGEQSFTELMQTLKSPVSV